MRTLRLALISAFALFLSAPLCGASEQFHSAGLSSLPSAAQSSISGMLGRDTPEYRVHATRDGLRFANPRQKLSTRFTRDAVMLSRGNASWQMSLRGFGYSNSLKVPDSVAPQASANRVEYRRGLLTEWYVNGPAGLEQGFTINQPPGKPNGQPLEIALAVFGDMSVAKQNDNSLTFAGRNGNPALRYSGLTAYDASGKELQSWLELRDKRLTLKVADAGAQYPVVVDPWVQLAELTPSDPTKYDQFGTAVSISGNTVVVGSYKPDAVSVLYVFVKPNSGWSNMTETAQLTEANGPEEDGFGNNVSISGDTVVAGVSDAAVGSNPFQGKALIFVKPANGWTDMTESATLTASDGVEFDQFGDAVAIIGDTIGVGAYAKNDYAGGAYVFVKPAGGWKDMTQTAELTPSDPQEDGAVGGSISVASNLVVAGSIIQVGSHSEQGAAYVFVKPSTGWADMTQTAKLTASNGQAGDLLSRAVAVDAVGDTVVAGAPGVGGYTHPGAAYVFVKPASGWADMTETAELTRHCRTQSCPEKGALGSSVSIGANGRTAFIGAPNLTVDSNINRGAIFEFVAAQSGWQTTSKPSAEILVSDGTAFDYFGTLAFSDSILVSGSYGYKNHQGDGVVYVFGK
jgi:hypothetical protein